MEPGTVADWVNAAGTYLAFSGATFAGVVAYRAYKIQSRGTQAQLDAFATEERHRRDSNQRSQATKVAMWIYRGYAGWFVQWVNASELPIYGVVVRILGENPTVSVAIERGTQGPSAPGNSRKLTHALRQILDERGASEMNPVDLKLEIAFTDAAGIRWLRDGDGRLRQVESRFNFQDAAERFVDRDFLASDDSLN